MSKPTTTSGQAALSLRMVVFTFGTIVGVGFGAMGSTTTDPNQYVMPANAVVGGKTIGEWTAECWKWVYSIPTNQNPQLDCEGRWANNSQPYPDVFFIAPVNGLIPPPCTRTFTVPENKRLLVPLLALTIDNIDSSTPLPIPELYNFIDAAVLDPRELHAAIDGVAITNLISHRATSPPFNFDFGTNCDDVLTLFYGHCITTVDPVIADGYWLMLEPLPRGKHTLRVGGTDRLGYFRPHDIILNITVAPDANQYVMPTNAVMGGKTIGEWSAEWWKWAYALPTNQNPLLDPDGSRAHNGQPDGEVFFIATGSGLSQESVVRKFSVPEHKYLLLNLLPVNGECIDTPPPCTAEDVRNGLAAIVANPRELHALIDGVAVTNLLAHRAASPVFSLLFTNADNLKSLQYGHPVTGLIDPQLSDGYWLLIEPLPPGEHVINFGGTFNELFNYATVDKTVIITVAPDANQYVMPTNAVIGGKTIGEWSAEWWKWAYALPTNQNPLLDPDGSRAHNGQPDGEVFFIATGSGLSQESVVRKFSVPEHKYLLLNLLPVNGECIDTPPPCTAEDVRNGLAAIVANPRELHALIDGVAVTNLLAHRAASPVFSLLFTNANNLKSLQYGHPVTGLIDPQLSDGYWLLIEPLPPGEHVINFGGTFNELFNYATVDKTVIITVAPDANQYVMPTNAVIGGKTIGDWAADGWKWVLPIPTSVNPNVDSDGSHAHVNQPDGPVFFIGGLSQISTVVERHFTVPEGKYLFVPLVSIFTDNVDTVPPLTIEEMRDLNTRAIDLVNGLHASIDGLPVTNLFVHRAATPVFSVEYGLPNSLGSSIYGRPITGLVEPMVSEGYFLMIRPLPTGRHILRFGANVGPPVNLFKDITDVITVVSDPSQQVMPTNAVVAGKTIGDWSAEFWKWAFAAPFSQHPGRDTTGDWADVAQPDGPVFFLAGVFQISGVVQRSFTVPEGKYLFVPLLSNEQDNVNAVPALSVEQLRDATKFNADLITELHASIDGVSVPNLFSYRAASPVFSFNFVSDDNLMSFFLDSPFTGLVDPILADGYYLLVKPLPLGTHVINFGGIVGPPVNFFRDITATITVVPDPNQFVTPTNAVSSNLLAVACPPAAAPDVPGSVAREDFWVPDGPVNALVETNGVLYVGGLFDYISPSSLTGGTFDQVSGAPVPNFPKVNGAIKAVEPDRAGGWFVGGIFNSVGGYPLTNLARIRADRTVDTEWNPNPDGAVLTMVTSPDKLYVGGTFRTIGGQPRSLLAALAIDTGVVLPFRADAVTAFPRPSVNALALSGNTLYLGGYFSFINGAGREHLGAVDAETGAVTPWYPNGYTGSQASSRIDAMAISGNTLVVGGSFTSIGGAQTNGPLRNFIAALDVNGPNLGSVTGWNPNADGPVTSLAIFCDVVYVGGAFTHIAGQPRNRIAALNLHTGEATAWDPNANGDVLSLRISGNTVFTGGKFTGIGGEARAFLAALDLDSGRARPWEPRADFGVAGLAASGGTVYAGGFVAGGGKLRKNLAAFDVRTGQPTDWAPEVTGETLINAAPFRGVYALAAADNTLFLGGPFTHLNGQPRSHAGAIDLSSGQTAAWNPAPNGIVESLAVAGQTVFLGGRFTQIGGAGRTNIAAVDAVAGVATDWNPGANDKVMALAVCGNAVFAGGIFTSIGGSPHNRLAALDLESGLPFNWNPFVNDQVSAIAVAGSQLYLGGQFSSVNGQGRNRLTALDAGAAALACWNPNVRTFDGLERSAAINTMVVAENAVFVGGSFNLLAGEARNNLAALSTDCSGAAASWNPNPDGPVLALALSRDTLFTAGNFQNMGGQFRPYLAVFPRGGAPRIVTQPLNEQVGLGGNVTFAAAATGEGALSFQWEFNGRSIPGATSSSITIADAQVSDSGEYRLVVTNAVGLASSRAATLTVVEPVAILAQPSSQTTERGGTVSLNVTATGNPVPSYQWRLNGVNIPGAIYPTLVISNAQPQDGGSYSVIVANLGGAISSEIALVRVMSTSLPFEDDFASIREDPHPAKLRKEKDKPKFNKSPIRTANGVGSGNNSAATSEAGEPNHAGKPSGKSMWLSWISPATGVAVFNTRGSDFDTLLGVYARADTGFVEVASDEDRGGFATSQAAFNAVAGTEYLIAIDGFGGASGNIVLSWNLDTSTAETPKIIIQPNSQTIFAGQNVTFAVTAASATPEFYQWFFNCELIPGATNRALVISGAQQEHVGSYYVQVMNASRYVTESHEAFLEIGPAPDVLSRDKLEDVFGARDFLLGDLPEESLVQPAAVAQLTGGFLLVAMGTIDSQLVNNTTATTSLRETNHCGVLGGSSKWLGLRPLANGVMQVDTIGSAINTVLAVYTGTNLLSIRQVACDDNGAPDGIRSLARFNAQANTDYLVAVDGVNGAKGAISINWRLGGPPSIAGGAPVTQVFIPGGTLSLFVTATSLTPDITYRWRYAGTNMPGQTNAVLTLTNLQSAQSGTYAVIVRNFAGSTTNVFTLTAASSIVLRSERMRTSSGEVFRVFSTQSASQYLIQGSLSGLDTWTNLFTNDSATPGPIDFRDPTFLQRSNRYYRAVPR